MFVVVLRHVTVNSLSVKTYLAVKAFLVPLYTFESCIVALNLKTTYSNDCKVKLLAADAAHRT